jgi:hypothetical protein
VDKDRLLAHINRDLQDSPEVARACEAVVRFVETHRPEVVQHLSFAALSRAAGLSSPAEAVPVAQYLSSNRIRFLARAYFLVVDGEEFEIATDDVIKANEERVLYHPDLGEPVENFEQSLYLYFTPGEEAQEIVGRAV